MSKLLALKSATTLSDVAHLLRYSARSLSYILYKISPSIKYYQFKIKKSSGGERTIKSPCPELKFLQTQLFHLLDEIYVEIHGEEYSKFSLSHGFRRNHSIITNAQRHVSKRYVFNIDIKDFFPSINFGRVRGFFMKDKTFELHPNVATIIAQICCFENEIPQGSPTSPLISNFIGHILDIRLVTLAKQAGCQYSRYADDITFSSNHSPFPKSIAIKDVSGKWLPSDILTKILNNSGFEINDNKINMQYHVNRQTVTGLVVNKKINTKSAYYRQIRSQCHALFRTGSFYPGSQIRFGYAKKDPKKTLGTIDQLRGHLTHIYNIKSHQKDDQGRAINNKTGIFSLYNKFIYFENFHVNSLPIIIGEGKTDYIYIKSAIQSRYASHPTLATKSGKDLEFHFRFFSRAERVFNSTGVGGLIYFVNTYEKMTKSFTTPGTNNPIIIVLDNDQEAQKMFSVIKERKKIAGKITGTDPYYHVLKKIYVVPIPKLPKKHSTIMEDLFDQKWKRKKFFGKTLELDDKKFDPTKNYTKTDFAEKIIRPNRDMVDFSLFDSLLKNISLVIDKSRT